VLVLLRDCVAHLRRHGIAQWDDRYPDRTAIEGDVGGDEGIVATDATGLRGYVALGASQDPAYVEVPWAFQTGPIGVIGRLMVDPAHQGRGLAKALMGFAEKRAEASGCRAVRLDAFVGNPRAIRLYERLGYREAGTIRHRTGEFRCFERSLRAATEVHPEHREPGSSPEGGSIAEGRLLRLAAFSRDPEGGNPAGVWIGATLPRDADMQRIAAEVGYSETAFVSPMRGFERTIRYFSPEAEVPFCGHATIDAGVALGESDGDGVYHFRTPVGSVRVVVARQDGVREASLTSVLPESVPARAGLVSAALSTLGWSASDLDATIPPARAFAGAWHLVLAVAAAERLARLDYDFGALKTLMLREGLTTLQLIWREGPTVFRSRNPFPVGGVVEDPATGAAAAALGGYLRDSGLMAAPATILIRQGDDVGRPSRLLVTIPASGGIVVTGAAVPIARTHDAIEPVHDDHRRGW
jgi:PhzF family phenazine biosynthesis protein